MRLGRIARKSLIELKSERCECRLASIGESRTTSGGLACGDMPSRNNPPEISGIGRPSYLSAAKD